MGIKEAASATPTETHLHFIALMANSTAAMYATNKIPCAQPTTFTAKGQPKKYFSGIATSNKIKNEMPSVIPTNRSSFILNFIELLNNTPRMTVAFLS